MKNIILMVIVVLISFPVYGDKRFYKRGTGGSVHVDDLRGNLTLEQVKVRHGDGDWQEQEYNVTSKTHQPRYDLATDSYKLKSFVDINAENNDAKVAEEIAKNTKTEEVKSDFEKMGLTKPESNALMEKLESLFKTK